MRHQFIIAELRASKCLIANEVNEISPSHKGTGVHVQSIVG
jgi:hypothetical protein